MKGELGIPFPLLSDADEQAIKRYGLVHSGEREIDISRPANILIDRQGVIRWEVFTESIRIRPHPDDVLKVARGLP